jgi:hypothetical protein
MNFLAIKGATVPVRSPLFHFIAILASSELLRPDHLKPSAPPFFVEPLLSDQAPREHAAEFPRSSLPRSASSSTLERGTTSSATSALAAAALLDKLRRIVGPSDTEDLRRRPQVSSLAWLISHFPTLFLGPVGIYSFFFLCFSPYRRSSRRYRFGGTCF